MPCTKQLIDGYEKDGASTISLDEAPKEKVERCGIIKGRGVGKEIYKIENLLKSH